MTSTPSNVANLHRKPEEERHHDIHPSVSPHTSDEDIHRLGHSSGHPSHTTHVTEGKESHEEDHRGTHPTFVERIQGVKEKLQGKITHNPELVKHGKDLLSGSIHNESGHEPRDQALVNKDLDGQRQAHPDNTRA